MRPWRPRAPAAAAASRLPPLAPCRRLKSSAVERLGSVRSLLQRPATTTTDGASRYYIVNGLVQTVRRHKKVAFAAVGDGSCPQTVQVVLSPEQAKDLSTGVAVEVEGAWIESPNKSKQTQELRSRRVTVLGDNDANSYPLQPKYHSAEFLRTLPHLRSRLPANALLLRLRSQVIASLTEFFAEHGHVQTHPPIITSSDCEGGGEVFGVEAAAAAQKPASSAALDAGLSLQSPSVVASSAEAQETPSPEPASPPDAFFRAPKYLTVSSQLHLEALVPSVGKVWTLSPTFRAERSDTPRHLSEFYMLEAELCFTTQDGLHTVTQLVQKMLRHVVLRLESSSVGQDLLRARSVVEGSPDTPNDGGGLPTSHELQSRWDSISRRSDSDSWTHVSYEEAVKTLQAAAARGQRFEFRPAMGAALQAEHERFLAAHVGEGSPIFVTHYPRDIKAFYMAPGPRIYADDDDGADVETAACFDLLVPEVCELAGGSVREHRLPELLQSMARHGMIEAAHESKVPDALKWYVDLRRYGSVPHGGFGLGFDRLLSYLSGVPSVRDVVAFPRWHGRCDC